MVLSKQKKMSTPQSKGLDRLKWFLVLVLFVGGVVANAHYSELAGAIRAAVGVLVVALGLVVAGLTQKGRAAWTFIKSARSELRKVVWPTRAETIQTVLMVVVVVIIMALILWGLDSMCLLGMGWLTGQKG